MRGMYSRQNSSKIPRSPKSSDYFFSDIKQVSFLIKNALFLNGMSIKSAQLGWHTYYKAIRQ